MLPSHKVRILVATQPVDFRKGHDGLAALVQSALKEDPFTGTVFVFRAKRADRLKILFWDGSGLVMAYKRLEENTFTWPAIRDGVMTLNRAQFEALFAGLDWRRSGRWRPAGPLRQSESRGPNGRALPIGSGYRGAMPAAATIDLSALPDDQRDAVAALLRENSVLKEINARLEHLVAELNHVVHGKKSEKLSEDDRQLTFEDLEVAVGEVEAKRDTQAPSEKTSRRTSAPTRRNRGNLPADLPRIERIVEPDSLDCPCGCGPMHRIGEDRTERLDIVPA